MMKPHKDLKVALYCSATKPATLPEGKVYSETCGLLVALEGKATTTGQIRYDLSIEEEEDSHRMLPNHFTYIRVFEKDKKSYKLEYNHPSTNASGLAFIFDGKFGISSICIGVNDQTNCKHNFDIDANSNGLTQAYRRVVIDLNKEANRGAGVYYVRINAKQDFAGLIFGITELSEFGGLVAKDLKAGIPMADGLKNSSFSQLYSFHVSSKSPNDYSSLEAIRISLHSTRGQFIMVVRNDDEKPTLENYLWKTGYHELTITRDDPLFKPDAIYLIAVFALSDAAQTEDLHYLIKWTYTDKHSLLQPKAIDYGTLIHNHQCFVAEIMQHFKSLMFIKGGDGNIDMFISIGNQHHTPSASHHDFHIRTDEYGLELKMQDVKMQACAESYRLYQHCNAYICLSGREGKPYTLGYTYDNQPFTLPHAKVIQGPVPVGDATIRFIYHPPKDSSLDVEEFSASEAVFVSGRIQEETEFADWSKLQHGKSNVISLFHVWRDVVNTFKKPLVLIQISSRLKADAAANNNSNFVYKLGFGLEAGYEMKELLMNVPVTAHASQGRWVYYYFYYSDKIDTLVVMLDSINGGDCDMFLGRGKDTRPTNAHYVVRSYDYGSSYLKLTYEQVRAKGYPDLQGFYVLAVRANSNAFYSLRWKKGQPNVMFANFGKNTELWVARASKSHIVLYNYMKDEIQLIMDSHHNNLRVYWSTQNPDQVYKESDFELFPNALHNRKSFEINKISTISKFDFKTTDPGYCSSCRHFFTFENLNPIEPIKLDLLFNKLNSSVPQEISLSTTTIGFTDSASIKKYLLAIPISDLVTLNKYSLELQVLYGAGDIAIDKMDNKNENLIKSVSFRAGYNSFSMDSLVGTQPTTSSNQRIANIEIKLSCHSNCAYRLTIFAPNTLAKLIVNSPRESFLASGDHSETFVYESSNGAEKKFDVSLVVEELTSNGQSGSTDLTEAELQSILTVYHTTSKESLNTRLGTILKTITSHVDPLNGKIGMEYPIVKGFYLVAIKALPTKGFRYRLEVNTEYISTLLPGRNKVGVIPNISDHHLYEMYTHQPSSIFLKLSKCFGEPNLRIVQPEANNSQVPVAIDYDRYTRVWETTKPGQQVYMRIEKGNDQKAPSEVFGYLDHTKEVTVFNIEAFDASSWSRVPLDEIKPFDDEMFIDLKSNPPLVHFRPLAEAKHLNLQMDVNYFVVLSKDPETLDYYLNCNQQYLDLVLKPGYSAKEVVQVYQLPQGSELYHESTTLKPYYTMKIPVDSGHRYFMSVYAQVYIYPPNDQTSGKSASLAANQVRVIYHKVEFEYHSFLYPIELLASTLGLLGLIIATCCVMNTKFMAAIKRNLNKKFRNLETKDIDEDLEDYFMRIKLDYELHEKKNQPQTEIQSQTEQKKPETEDIGNVPADVKEKQQKKKEEVAEAKEKDEENTKESELV